MGFASSVYQANSCYRFDVKHATIRVDTIGKGPHYGYAITYFTWITYAQSQHGYQINEFIERNLSTITDMKKPTAYATLDKLSKQGYIEVHTEQEGNRPPRKVYSINEKGKQYFYELLIQNLSSAESVKFSGDIC